MRDLSTIAASLRVRRAELLQRVNVLEMAVRHDQEALDDDFAEQAVQRQNDEVLSALDENCVAELRRINEALRRLDEGHFGICVACNNEIPIERLEVLPFAERCIDCAELDD